MHALRERRQALQQRHVQALVGQLEALLDLRDADSQSVLAELLPELDDRLLASMAGVQAALQRGEYTAALQMLRACDVGAASDERPGAASVLGVHGPA